MWRLANFIEPESKTNIYTSVIKSFANNDNLRALLKRLYEYGIRLRKGKCKLGKQSIIWFGHVFSKQGMSPDPDNYRVLLGGAIKSTKFKSTDQQADI